MPLKSTDMRFRVYGLDPQTSCALAPILVEAPSAPEAAARAVELGMLVRRIEDPETGSTLLEEPLQPAKTARPIEEDCGKSDHLVASVLVIVFRVVAIVSFIGYVILIGIALQIPASARLSGIDAVMTLVLQCVIVVSFFLTVAEGLRLGMAIERNTRRLS